MFLLHKDSFFLLMDSKEVSLEMEVYIKFLFILFGREKLFLYVFLKKNNRDTKKDLLDVHLNNSQLFFVLFIFLPCLGSPVES